jgi:hypothetical protein
MRERGLYTTDKDEIRARTERYNLTGIYEERLL